VARTTSRVPDIVNIHVVTSSTGDENMQLTINSFRELFSDKFFP